MERRRDPLRPTGWMGANYQTGLSSTQLLLMSLKRDGPTVLPADCPRSGMWAEIRGKWGFIDHYDMPNIVALSTAAWLDDHVYTSVYEIVHTAPVQRSAAEREVLYDTCLA